MTKDERNLGSQIRVALAALALLATAAAVGVSIVASVETDRQAAASQRALVEHAFHERIEAIAKEQESITVWDDHVTKAREGDQQWLTENVGAWMYDYFGHERAYVLDSRNGLVFAMRDGRTIEQPELADDRETLLEVAADLRRRLIARRDAGSEADALAHISATEVVALNGQPAILSMRPIIPYSDRISVPAGAEYLYASLDVVDDSFASEIGNHILLKDMRFDLRAPSDSSHVDIAVVGSNGQILGHLVWQAYRPGFGLLTQILPVGLSVVFLVGCIAAYLGRKLRRTSQDLYASERLAHHLASHDLLTRLPNRGYFESRVEEVLERIRDGDGEAALLFLDLDRFKYINDTLGHRAGDELVRQTAVRLSAVVGTTGTVARIGGDEFGIVIGACENAQEAAQKVSEELLSTLESPFQIDGETVYVNVSIGIATAPHAGVERQELLRKADIALYDAKKHGRGCHRTFSDAMGDILKQRQRVEADLRNALASGTELQLHYQPLYSDTREILGAEALLRWNHPVHRAISPLFIISVAEESGLIMQLGDWILREACRVARKADLPLMSINISAVQLRDAQFAERCLSIIRAAGLEPGRIQVEVTETVLIEIPEIAISTFTKMRNAGISVAIDDFGTGYSSMSYLRNYPVDRLKIDRSFVQGLSESSQGQAIVGAMLEMARAMDLHVIAEGVETMDQSRALSQLGCNEMQGYLFSRPLNESQFLRQVSGTMLMSA